MTVHGPAIQRQPAVRVPGANWAFATIVGVILITAALLIAFPPRAVETGRSLPAAAADPFKADLAPRNAAEAADPFKADLAPRNATPVAHPASIIGYPSGFTATYSPVKGTGVVTYPSGFTATYSPLAPTAHVIGYPSGFTTSYNPLSEVVIP